MKTGGSNYITINGSMDEPVIGTYHQHPDTVAADLRDMFEHGQRQITLVLWFAPVDFAPEHVWHHVCDSSGGALCEQHRANLISLIAVITQVGFTELHLRFGPQGRALVREWIGGISQNQALFDEICAFTLDTIRLVEAAKGSLKVIYDLSVEHAWEVWNTNPTHRAYCMNLWRNYLNAGLDPAITCAFSVIHGAPGLQPMLLRIQQARLPFPGCYCFDVYGASGHDYEYQVLTGIVPVLTSFGQITKPIYIQETNYNDAISCADIRRALVDAPTLNFASIFQWPEVRDTEPGGGVPDVYPRRYDNFLVEV